MDRISGLPDELLLMIGESISAKTAASVKIMSTRFRNLFTIRRDLEFDDSVDPGLGDLTAFLNEILALPETTTHVGRFSLKCRRAIDSDHLNNCLREVLRCGVVDFELDINGGNEYSPLSEIFTSDTVVNMKLGENLVISDIPADASLPELETLHIDRVRFNTVEGCAFRALILACPVLEELIIDEMEWETWKWSGVLSSQTLQRLTIRRTMSEGFQGPEFQSISLDTPALVYLDYSDFVPDAYGVVNLDSIVEAELFLQVVVNQEWHAIFPQDGDPISSNPTNLFQGLRNVQVLHLKSPITSEYLINFITYEDFCWTFLPFLLNKTPNLHTLVIEGGVHYVEGPEYVCDCVSGYSFLSSCPVKVLEICLWDHGTAGELEQVKHLVGKLSSLELLKVTCGGALTDREKLRVSLELLRFPRASAKCDVQLSFR